MVTVGVLGGRVRCDRTRIMDDVVAPDHRRRRRCVRSLAGGALHQTRLGGGCVPVPIRVVPTRRPYVFLLVQIRGELVILCGNFAAFGAL